MSNSPPHIGTRGQTLGVKQPDSAPGGLLIKRLLKTDILNKSVKFVNCPILILAQCKDDKQKMALPSIELLIS